MDSTNNFPTFFDNTLRIKNEADAIALTGDRILRIKKVKEKYSFRINQKVQASGNGRWKEGRTGKVVHRFKQASGYNQYVVQWHDLPKSTNLTFLQSLMNGVKRWMAWNVGQMLKEKKI